VVRLERGNPPARWIVRIVVGLVIVSQGAALLGDLFLAGIVDRNPELLIALNPRNRNLALATTQLSAVAFYGIGFARLVVSDPLYYLLGYWYGDRAIAWTERRSRTYGPLIRDGERFFRRSSYPLIFIAPNNIICAMSAATGVRLPTFIALNLSGTVVRLYLVRQLGEIFRSPLESIIDFIAAYRIPLLVLSALLVAWTVFGELKGGKDSELSQLRHLDDEPEPKSDTEHDGPVAIDGVGGSRPVPPSWTPEPSSGGGGGGGGTDDLDGTPAAGGPETDP